MVGSRQVHEDSETQLDKKQTPDDHVRAMTITQRREVQVVEVWGDEGDPYNTLR